MGIRPGLPSSLCLGFLTHSHTPRYEAHTAHSHTRHGAGRPLVPRTSGCSLAFAPIIPFSLELFPHVCPEPSGILCTLPPALIQFFREHCDLPKITEAAFCCGARDPWGDTESCCSGEHPCIHSASQASVCLFSQQTFMTPQAGCSVLGTQP